jgi:hypothetical protein
MDCLVDGLVGKNHVYCEIIKMICFLFFCLAFIFLFGIYLILFLGY